VRRLAPAVALLVVSAVGAGCGLAPVAPAPVSDGPAVSGARPSGVPPRAGSPPPAGGTSASLAAGLAAAHRKKAEALERSGDLRRALDEWKLALTIDPGDAAARRRRVALETRIEAAVAERLRQGREAIARGAFLEARRHFLAVLALDPAHRGALEILQSQVRELRVAVHTVRPGETLASIAEQYYGDRTRGEAIGAANGLPAGARVAAGDRLRVPEVPGVPFLVADTQPRVTAELAEVNPLVAEAREAMERGDWLAALADVDRLLATSPTPPEAVELRKAVLFGLGRSQVAERRFPEAYQTLGHLIRMDPDYRDASVLWRQAREGLVEHRYSEGLRLYREERLEEAIAEWRATLELDPEHGNARRNLEQAERVLRGLQQRRRAPAAGPGS
jgi:tetratricopeptide (TPR) repeat protein